jgi:hypothetical protein
MYQLNRLIHQQLSRCSNLDRLVGYPEDIRGLLQVLLSNVLIEYRGP